MRLSSDVRPRTGIWMGHASWESALRAGTHGAGDLDEGSLSDAARRGAPIAQDGPGGAAVAHQLGPALPDGS